MRSRRRAVRERPAAVPRRTPRPTTATSPPGCRRAGPGRWRWHRPAVTRRPPLSRTFDAVGGGTGQRLPWVGVGAVGRGETCSVRSRVIVAGKVVVGLETAGHLAQVLVHGLDQELH